MEGFTGRGLRLWDSDWEPCGLVQHLEVHGFRVWGLGLIKSSNLGYKYSYPTYHSTYYIATHEPPSIRGPGNELNWSVMMRAQGVGV